MNRLWLVLLPELHQFPAPEQDAALRKARSTVLDLREMLGMAAGVVLVTAATRQGVSGLGMAGSGWATTLSFAVALPLLALCLGPLHVRRLRRGLQAQLRHRQGRP